ncbi:MULTISPECIES: type II secretion system protein GspM [unclassified Acidovorax]|uniref:type II secretion system protein GspM n=1 Tax=unclassified Acidovorax TaxID=2684926 RepID=UPI000ADCD182|nr:MULTISPECIES: type II secretion system protein GspM [unclassified Acidovorax]MBW8463155.1 type II secretion system protein M [Acidovorax sp.]
MKLMNPWLRRAVVVVLLLFFGGLVCAALVYQALWARYDNALQQLEPRSERLEGVVNAGADIETLLGTANGTVAPWLHPGGEAAQNEVQQKLRQMIVASGSTLVSSQAALEPGAEGKLARIRLTATVTGDWSKLVGFMESLQMHRPPFWVRTASITREGASAGAGPQAARLALQLEAPLAPEKVTP